MMHVYIARTAPFLPDFPGGKAAFSRACREIDRVRLAKVEACRGGENKARSLCCGLMLQYYLRKYVGTEKRVDIRYGYGASGKPYLPEYPRIHFNLSHSGQYAAAVFADREAGMDLQAARPVREGLAARVLSSQEYARYERFLSPGERADWFFRCWCAKESFSKLTGEGLAVDFRQITFLPEQGYIAGPETVCMEYVPAIGYYMNVCTARPEGEVLFPEEAEDITEELERLAAV